jgi:hypothetical protein
MRVVRIVAVTSVLALIGAAPSMAQDMARYRDYQLESTVAAVVAISGEGASEVESLHDRPGHLQRLEWHAPYVSSEGRVDALERIVFDFYEGKLYRMVVTYDRDSMAGLTDRDVVDALSPMYGTPRRAARTPRPIQQDDGYTYATVLAQWIGPTSEITLTRGVDTLEFQLVMLATRTAALARASIKESLRLDLEEAPGRERAKARQVAHDAEQARQKNKAAFRP